MESSGPAPEKQFESLRASTLFCRKCGQAMPVREKLLLILPGREIYEYLCVRCGESLGKREVGSRPQSSNLWTPR